MRYELTYEVTTSYTVTVERDEELTAEQVADTVSKDELANGVPGQVTWDEVKNAWRSPECCLSEVTRDGDFLEVR